MCVCVCVFVFVCSWVWAAVRTSPFVWVHIFPFQFNEKITPKTRQRRLQLKIGKTICNCCPAYTNPKKLFRLWYPTMREKCPNTEFSLVRIFLYSVRIQENTDQRKPRSRTFFTQCEISVRNPGLGLELMIYIFSYRWIDQHLSCFFICLLVCLFLSFFLSGLKFFFKLKQMLEIYFGFTD